MESPWLSGKGSRRGLVSQMSAGHGQKVLVDGEAVHLLKQDCQFQETRLQLLYCLGDVNGRPRRLHIKALPQLGPR